MSNATSAQEQTPEATTPPADWMEGLRRLRALKWSFTQIALELGCNDRSVRRWYAWTKELDKGNDPEEHPDAAYPRWSWMQKKIVQLATDPPEKPSKPTGPVRSQLVAQPHSQAS